MCCFCADEAKDALQYKRTRLKILADLLVTGIYRDYSILIDTLRHVAAVNFKADWAGSQSSMLLLSSFARHVSDELLGITSKGLRPFLADAQPVSLQVRPSAAIGYQTGQIDAAWLLNRDQHCYGDLVSWPDDMRDHGSVHGIPPGHALILRHARRLSSRMTRLRSWQQTLRLSLQSCTTIRQCPMQCSSN